MKFAYPTGNAFPLFLAPMAGVSEPPFRRICRELGADVLITEFLNSEGLRRRIARVLEGCEFDEIERPVGIQIYGADPRSMAEAAALVTEHYQPDFIDINFGCPVKKDIPVIGNGDINSAEDALRMRQHTGCAGIMIGRGSFGNPWLFRDARALLDGLPHPAAPSAEERFAVALRHARLAIELQGDTRHTVVEFRKHFGWYTRGLHGATRLRQRLFQVETMSEAQRVFEEYLAGAEVAAVS